MKRREKLMRMKIIVILILILSLAFVILASILREFTCFMSDYIDSGKSIFIPSLPDINVFWFLSENFRFSLGHLIDIIIICNIICYIETIFYHYCVIAFRVNKNQILSDFNLYVIYHDEGKLKKDDLLCFKSYKSFDSCGEKSKCYFKLKKIQKLNQYYYKSHKKPFIFKNYTKKNQTRNTSIFQIILHTNFFGIPIKNNDDLRIYSYFLILIQSIHIKIQQFLLILQEIINDSFFYENQCYALTNSTLSKKRNKNSKNKKKNKKR